MLYSVIPKMFGQELLVWLDHTLASSAVGKLEVLNSSFTRVSEGLVGGEGAGSMCMVKEDLREIGWKKLLGKCDVEHPIVANIERKIGWRTLWETALALGPRHTSGLQALIKYRLLRHHGRGMKPCPFCDSEFGVPLLDHVLDVHGSRLRISLTKSQVLEHLQLLVANIQFVYSYSNNYCPFLCCQPVPCMLGASFELCRG